MRIFLDANILFSAARADGAVRALLGLLLEAGHSCCVDAYVLEEARRNLVAKSASGLIWLEDSMTGFQVQPIRLRDKDLEAHLPVVEKDQPVLAAAIQSGCHYLVTGDRTHFGALFGLSIQGVKVMSPAQLAEELL
jgi:predicted nucleic acid-binding protein